MADQEEGEDGGFPPFRFPTWSKDKPFSLKNPPPILDGIGYLTDAKSGRISSLHVRDGKDFRAINASTRKRYIDAANDAAKAEREKRRQLEEAAEAAAKRAKRSRQRQEQRMRKREREAQAAAEKARAAEALDDSDSSDDSSDDDELLSMAKGAMESMADGGGTQGTNDSALSFASLLSELSTKRELRKNAKSTKREIQRAGEATDRAIERQGEAGRRERQGYRTGGPPKAIFQSGDKSVVSSLRSPEDMQDQTAAQGDPRDETVGLDGRIGVVSTGSQSHSEAGTDTREGQRFDATNEERTGDPQDDSSTSSGSSASIAPGWELKKISTDKRFFSLMINGDAVENSKVPPVVTVVPPDPGNPLKPDWYEYETPKGTRYYCFMLDGECFVVQLERPAARSADGDVGGDAELQEDDDDDDDDEQQQQQPPPPPPRQDQNNSVIGEVRVDVMTIEDDGDDEGPPVDFEDDEGSAGAAPAVLGGGTNNSADKVGDDDVDARTSASGASKRLSAIVQVSASSINTPGKHVTAESGSSGNDHPQVKENKVPVASASAAGLGGESNSDDVGRRKIAQVPASATTALVSIASIETLSEYVTAKSGSSGNDHPQVKENKVPVASASAAGLGGESNSDDVGRRKIVHVPASTTTASVSVASTETLSEYVTAESGSSGNGHPQVKEDKVPVASASAAGLGGESNSDDVGRRKIAQVPASTTTASVIVASTETLSEYVTAESGSSGNGHPQVKEDKVPVASASAAGLGGESNSDDVGQRKIAQVPASAMTALVSIASSSDGDSKLLPVRRKEHRPKSAVGGSFMFDRRPISAVPAFGRPTSASAATNNWQRKKPPVPVRMASTSGSDGDSSLPPVRRSTYRSINASAAADGSPRKNVQPQLKQGRDIVAAAAPSAFGGVSNNGDGQPTLHTVPVMAASASRSDGDSTISRTHRMGYPPFNASAAAGADLLFDDSARKSVQPQLKQGRDIVTAAAPSAFGGVSNNGDNEQRKMSASSTDASTTHSRAFGPPTSETAYDYYRGSQPVSFRSKQNVLDVSSGGTDFGSNDGSNLIRNASAAGSPPLFGGGPTRTTATRSSNNAHLVQPPFAAGSPSHKTLCTLSLRKDALQSTKRSPHVAGEVDDKENGSPNPKQSTDTSPSSVRSTFSSAVNSFLPSWFSGSSTATTSSSTDSTVTVESTTRPTTPEQFVDDLASMTDGHLDKLLQDVPENFVLKVIELFKDEKLLKEEKWIPRSFVARLLFHAKLKLASMPSLVELSLPASGPTPKAKPRVTVCGDTHGQFFDVLNIFELNGHPSVNNPYIFNGDFVDRGSFSVQLAILLLLQLIKDPESIVLIRGNHETKGMNKFFGFEGEVIYKYDPKILQQFQETFECLPLAAVVGGKVFVTHGGLPAGPLHLDDIRNIDRVREPPESGLMADLLWADPHEGIGTAPSMRGDAPIYRYGRDITEAFLRTNNLSLLVRSHEVPRNGEGYMFHHRGRAITVFSAPNYCDSSGNKGAFLHFDETFVPKVTQFDAVPHPDVPPMAYQHAADTEGQ